MKRRRILFSFVFLLDLGCGHGTGGSSPTVLGVSSPALPPPAAPYGVSGTVRYYRSGPARGITVRANGNDVQRATETDSDGRFKLDGIYAGVEVFVNPPVNDYHAEAYYYIAKENSALDFILYPRAVASIGEGFIDSSIAGDQLLGGNDTYAGHCAEVPCRLIEIGGGLHLTSPISRVRITLRWNNPASHLGLYIPTSAYYPVSVERLCCASALTGTFTLTGGDFDAFLVGFEEFAGHRPEANDVQPFQVSVEPVR